MLHFHMETYIQYLFYFIIGKTPIMRYFFPMLFIFFSFLAFYQFLFLTLIPLYKLIQITGEFTFTFFTLLLLVFIFFILWFWSFITLFVLDPGSIPSEVKKSNNQRKKCANTCQKCDEIKPNRTHHCSKCNKCYARMDHHCTLFGKCIALRNQKIFVVADFYSIVLSVLWFIFHSIFCYLYYNHITKNMKITFFTVIIYILIFSYQFHKQFKNIIHGKTFLEAQFGIDPPNQNNTILENIEEVFGEPSWKWFFPIVSNQSYSIYHWEMKTDD